MKTLKTMRSEIATLLAERLALEVKAAPHVMMLLTQPPAHLKGVRLEQAQSAARLLLASYAETDPEIKSVATRLAVVRREETMLLTTPRALDTLPLPKGKKQWN